MDESVRDALQAALARVFAPLAGLLLEAGVGVGEVVPLLKRAYIQAAQALSDAAGGRPNISQLAVLTGLTRNEVSLLLRDGQSATAKSRGRQRAQRVLTGWWNDPDFQTTKGAPAILPVQGGKGSFDDLCRRYSGAVETARVLEELVRVKAVRRTPDDHVEALSRTYATVRWSAEGIEAVGEQLSDHFATLAHNLKNPTRALFAGRVANTRLKPEFVRTLRRDLEDEAVNLTQTADRMLNDPRHTAAARDSDAVELGMAIYLFERAAHPDTKPRATGEPVKRRAPRASRARSKESRTKNRE